MTPGQALAAKRGERGLTIEQAAAATRIRPERLRALEADDLSAFAAPVYAKGTLRAYATYLGLEPEELVAGVGATEDPALAVALDDERARPRFVLTTQALAAAGVVLIVSAFAGYAWRQMATDQRAVVTQAAPSTTAVRAVTSASPAVQPRPIVVGVHVVDTVWINVVVDGTPFYGSQGRTLATGSVVYFTGTDVKVTSGKASATIIVVDGRNLGPMGVGVATREFSSQTSP